jgi:GR25 family glycosyltransferase involved in LPS biosynthesis
MMLQDLYNYSAHFSNISTFDVECDETEDNENLSEKEIDTLKHTLVIVINVQRSTYRRERALKLIKKLNMHAVFFNAVDAKDLVIHNLNSDRDPDSRPEDIDVSKVHVVEYKNNFYLVDYTRRFDYIYRGDMPKGMMGCALSHLMIYNYVQFENRYKHFIILEDDFTLAVPPRTIRKCLGNVPKEYDMIHLNSESKWYPIQGTSPVNDNTYYCHILRRHFNASVSYALSKTGAAKLMAYCRDDITRPPDDLLSNLHTLGGYTTIASNTFLFGNNYELPSDCERFSDC